MSYIVIKVFSFECDYPRCGDACDVQPNFPHLREAVRVLRDAERWTARSHMHFCPKHSPTQVAIVVAERLSALTPGIVLSLPARKAEQ